MVRRFRIGIVMGDGIGPEIMRATLSVLEELPVEMEFLELQAGYEYYRRTGKLLEDEFFDRARELHAILKGPLTTLSGPGTYRSINILIRQTLGLYANVRPFTSYRGVSLGRFDFVVIRENTEGLYSGVEGRFGDQAFTLRIITRRACERIVRFAFNYAVRRRMELVTCVHKANVLKESDGLFRNVFQEIAAEYSSVRAEEMHVDAAAYNLVKNPGRFRVIVTPNLYGDILSDEAAGLVGSLGLCGSAQIGDEIGVFEPVHGSAPDIAGKGIANPLGQITAATLMLEYIGEKYNDVKAITFSRILRKAMREVVEENRTLTPDLGGSAGTLEVAREVIERVRRKMERAEVFPPTKRSF